MYKPSCSVKSIPISVKPRVSNQSATQIIMSDRTMGDAEEEDATFMNGENTKMMKLNHGINFQNVHQFLRVELMR